MIKGKTKYTVEVLPSESEEIWGSNYIKGFFKAKSESATQRFYDENGDFELGDSGEIDIPLDENYASKFGIVVRDGSEQTRYEFTLKKAIPETSLKTIHVGSKAIEVNEDNLSYDVIAKTSDLNKNKEVLLKAIPKKDRAKVYLKEEGKEEVLLGKEGQLVSLKSAKPTKLQLIVKDIDQEKIYDLNLKRVINVYKHVKQYTTYPGKKIKLLTPKGVARSKMAWKSYSTKVATVDKNGKLIAKNAGVAKVRGLVKYKTKHYYYMYYIRVRPGKPTNFKAKKQGKYVTLSGKLPQNRHGVAVYRAKRNSKGKYKFKLYKVYKFKKSKWSKKIKQPKGKYAYYLRAYRMTPKYSKNSKGKFVAGKKTRLYGYKSKKVYVKR